MKSFINPILPNTPPEPKFSETRGDVKDYLPTDRNSQAAVQLKPRPAATETIAILDEPAAELYSELCFFYEPSDRWVLLPAELQYEIDSGQWDGARSEADPYGIAQLQVAELVDVAIGGAS